MFNYIFNGITIADELIGDGILARILFCNGFGRSLRSKKPSGAFRHSIIVQNPSLWARSSRSLYLSQMTANWGRAAFGADDYILGAIEGFAKYAFPYSVTSLAYSSHFFP